MTGELIPLDLHAVVQGPGRHHPAVPDRPDRGDQPVQLPAQPGRPQARAGHRQRQPDRPQAAVQGPAHDARRSPRSSMPPACPTGMVSILPMTRELGDRMVADERFKLLDVHRQPERRLADEGAGRQEEGRPRARRQRRASSSTRRADLDWAVKRILVGAFAYAGQVCISVQRMFVHEAVWDAFMDQVPRRASAALKVGDPLDPTTDVGPMVDANQAAPDPALGRRGGGAGRPGPGRWHGPTARSSRRPS